jgi:hypothetical protein
VLAKRRGWPGRTPGCAEQALTLKATNFKASVREGWRHDLYMDVWSTMNEAQHRRHARAKPSAP